MKKLFWLLLFVPALAYSQPSLCTVTGTVYTPDGDTAKGAIITVVKAVKGGVLISKQSKDYRADKNGSITLLLHRGSTTWLYGEIAGMDSLGKAGVPVVVPDNPTATLSTLVKAGVPPKYTVLIGSAADTASSVRITHPSIPGFTAVNAADTNRVLRVDASGNIVLTWKGGGGASTDTSGAFALTVAQAARSVADTAGDFALSVAQSAYVIADTAGNFALSVAQSAAVEADTAGNFALSVAQSATVTANAAFAKADTGALHAQKFKNLEDAIGGKGDSDSLSNTTATANAALAKSDTTNQVRTTHPNIPGLAADTTGRVLKIGATGNIFTGYLPPSGLTNVDSVIMTTRILDTIAPGVASTDSLRYVRRAMVFLPQLPPHDTAVYDGNKLIGWVDFEFVIGGFLLRATAYPVSYLVYSDSSNGVSVRGIIVRNVSFEATTLGRMSQRTTAISFNSTTGISTTSGTAIVSGGTNAAIHTGYPLGTTKRLYVLASSGTDAINYEVVSVRVFFAMDQGNASNWYVNIK